MVSKLRIVWKQTVAAANSKGAASPGRSSVCGIAANNSASGRPETEVMWVHERCLNWSPQTTYGGVLHYFDDGASDGDGEQRCRKQGSVYNLDRLLTYSRTRHKNRFLFKCREYWHRHYIWRTIVCVRARERMYGCVSI